MLSCAGDPVRSERLHPVLVLHAERGRVLPAGDQADAAERPGPVLHQVHNCRQASTSSCRNPGFYFFNPFFLRRSKEVDWQPYFTTRLVDDFATHLRVFRKAQDRLADREDKQSELVCHCVVLLCVCVCGEGGGGVRWR